MTVTPAAQLWLAGFQLHGVKVLCMITMCHTAWSHSPACMCFADDILGITSSPTKRRSSTDYVCRPVVLTHPTRDLPHIHIHSNSHLQTVVEGIEDSRGGPDNLVQSEASEGVHGISHFCNSILLPSDSQNWNVNFDLRRNTVVNLAEQTQLASALEEEANSDSHCSEKGPQLSQTLENDEEEEDEEEEGEEGEGDCTVTGLSHLAPRTKRVIILQNHEGTFVSVGKEMNKTATEESAHGEGSPAS